MRRDESLKARQSYKLRNESLKARQSYKLRSFEDLIPDKIAKIGFEDPTQAARLLQDLAGHDIPDARFEELLPALSSSLSQSADPDRALANTVAWLANVGNRSMYYGILSQHPAALDALVSVFSASQFLSDILIRNPEYFEVLANPAMRDRQRTLTDFLDDAGRRIWIARTLNAKRDALRRFKPPEVLRIGARDILGFADVPTTVAEISDFAEACVRCAVQIAEAEKDFAVIAMGKLGGSELNYASDIDLIFVHADSLPQDQALKIAESVQDTLARRTDAGLVFRVDLRLRPEGRFGPISRSLSSCRAYYESWAENWERQALLKARFIAGDEAVGQSFMQMVDPFVYRPLVEERFIEDIRANKRRIEKKAARAGESETNVKEGVGAIRDVEFAVQLLQLVAGGAHPSLRTANTLEALDHLVEFSLLSSEERSILRESYLFLRHVEHRLQIMDERPVRNIPTEPSALRKFGRNLGYADGDDFLTDYHRHTSRVNALFRQLFYGENDPHSHPLSRGGESGADGQDDPGLAQRSVTASGSLGKEVSDLVRTADDPGSRNGLLSYLREKGFDDPDSAYGLLRFSQVGSEYGEFPPEARERFAELAPRLIEAASLTSSPDTALQGIDSLALAVPSRAALYLSLTEDEDLVERLCLLAAESPSLWQALLNHLEYLDMLTEDSLLSTPSPAPSLPKKAAEKPLAAFLRHERLRIGAQDIWGLISTTDVMEQITGMAQAAISACLTRDSKLSSGLAVIGMGKLGGAELGYSSDLDVLWVASERVDTAASATFAEGEMALLRSDLRVYGESYEIDARLRPEGRFGSLVRKVADYASYYRDSADTWEKQALIKARFIAGDEAVGEEFLALSRSIVYNHPPTEAQVGDMRHMKSRIENERAKNPADIKLGPGGLSDIEWVAQLLQWLHGKRWKKAQVPGTLPALVALRDAGVLRQDDWETLSQAYLALTHLRNRQWLKDGRVMDTPANQPLEMRRQVRAIFDRLFLGKTG